MKLLMHPASPNVCAVRVTAALCNTSLELQQVDAMNGEQSGPAFRSLNPNGLFPVLIDEDFVLWETVPIMQYIAAKQPASTLWPQNERQRADICRWQCWNLAHWSRALQVYIFENYFKHLKGLGSPNVEAIESVEATFRGLAAILEQQLTNRPHLTGNELTLADISVASYLMYAEAASIPLSSYPLLRAWLRRIENLPAWRAAGSGLARA